MPILSQAAVVAGVSREVEWWMEQRLGKLRGLSHESMAINPFMAPLLVAIHSHANFEELAEFLLGGHFMVGHATGFGKLVDEKILPKVFGTTKLDARFRKTPPYDLSVFTEIDHIIHDGADQIFLSLKASRWTIQLTMAMQLNHAFKQLIALRDTRPDVKFSKLMVGVIYGTEGNLTDKFSVIRGITGRVLHDVTDITAHVEVVAGRNLWAWLNGGEPATQDWVMDGVIDAIAKSKRRLEEAATLLEGYKRAFTGAFAKHVDANGKIDWHAILKEISG